MSIAAEGFHTVGSLCGLSIFTSIPTSPHPPRIIILHPKFPPIQCPFENSALLFAFCRIILPFPIAGWLLQVEYRFFLSVSISLSASVSNPHTSLHLRPLESFIVLEVPSIRTLHTYCLFPPPTRPTYGNLISSFTYRTACAPSVAFVPA